MDTYSNVGMEIHGLTCSFTRPSFCRRSPGAAGCRSVDPARRARRIAPGMSSQPTRKERELAWRRSEILDAAEEVFGRRGYGGAKMAEIAVRAEFGVGYLYKVFDDKSALYEAVIERRFGELHGTLDELIAGEGSPKEKIRGICEAIIDHFGRHEAFFRLALRDSGHLPGRLARGLEQRKSAGMRELGGRLAAVFEEGVAAGEFVPSPPDHLAYLFLGAVSFLCARLLEEPESRPADAKEEVARLLFEGITTQRNVPQGLE